MARSLVIISLAVGKAAAAAAGGGATTCGSMKALYKQEVCCGMPDKEVGFQIVPDPKKGLALSTNPCDGMKPPPGSGYDNIECFLNDTLVAIEQSGGDVTAGYNGAFDAGERVPIVKSYFSAGLCPVNVHWHLGAEHRSAGEYDEAGKSPHLAGHPETTNTAAGDRRLAGEMRYGYACHNYDADDPKFTTPYNWQHCIDMYVGETYEVHWPHSAIGACQTPHQFQSPFYDGVFCGWTQGVADAVAADAQVLASAVGVQAQIFTIVNDESYYYPDLMRGAIVDHEMWADVAAYTGSTTGTTRSNEICSKYTPITWQVDRKCHLISASTFDKMCADMKQQADDMTMDLHAHGARETVLQVLQADNTQDYR